MVTQLIRIPDINNQLDRGKQLKIISSDQHNSIERQIVPTSPKSNTESQFKDNYISLDLKLKT